MLQLVMMYMMMGIMYTMIIFSNPDEQAKTELMLTGMEIPTENQADFRLMIAFIMIIFWPVDMIIRSKNGF